MIQWMHRLSKSMAATLLMGALALSFVVWGIADVFTGQSSTAVATVGGTEIDATAFQRSYRNFVRVEGQRMGQELTPDMAQKMGLGNVALQQMIGRTALDNYAAKHGVVTGDGDVRQYVWGMQPFRGPTGQFDRATFLRAMQNAGYTENDFTQEVRSELTRGQLTGAVENNFILPPEYALALFLYINEKRAADYVIVSPDSVGPVAAPDDKTLAAFVKASPSRFSTPEYRDVQYAWITPADAQIAVSDAMIAQEYAARKATYNVPEKRDLEEIEFKTEADAKAARAKLDGGMPFEALAVSRGLKPADIGLGTLAQSDIPDPARAKAAFALQSGEVSQPVKGTFSWVLIKTNKITPGVSRALADVKDEIKTALAAQLAAGKLVDIVNAYEDAKNSGIDLAAAATKVGMKVGRLKAVDSSGLAPDGAKTDAPADPEFLAGVFRAEVGEDNDPFAAKSGAYYVIRVNGATPPKLKTLDQVRADASAQWISQKRATLLAVKAKALTDQATREKSLAGIAKALNVSVQKSPAIGRNTNDTMFSSGLVQQLFAAKPGGIVSGSQGLSGNDIIAQVTGISHPKPLPNSRDFQAAVQQLSGSVAGDFSISMTNAARLEQGGKINQKLVDSTVGGGG